MTPARFDIEDPLGAVSTEALSTRIDAFDMAVFYFDFRFGMADLAVEHPQLAVRAEVRVAGVARRARSAWRRRWRIAEASDTIRDDGKIDAETVIFQSLVRTSRIWLMDNPPPVGVLVSIARMLSGRIEGKASDFRVLSNEIELVANEMGTNGVQISGSFFSVQEALERHDSRLAWPTQHAPAFQLPSERKSYRDAQKAKKRDSGNKAEEVEN